MSVLKWYDPFETKLILPISLRGLDDAWEEKASYNKWPFSVSNFLVVVVANTILWNI